MTYEQASRHAFAAIMQVARIEAAKEMDALMACGLTEAEAREAFNADSDARAAWATAEINRLTRHLFSPAAPDMVQ